MGEQSAGAICRHDVLLAPSFQWNRERLLAGRYVPTRDGIAFIDGEDPPAVRGKSANTDYPLMLHRHSDGLPSFGVPKPNGIASLGRNCEPAARTEIQLVEPGTESSEGHAIALG